MMSLGFFAFHQPHGKCFGLIDSSIARFLMSSPIIVEHEKQKKMDGKDFIYFLEASVILYSEF